MTEALDRQIQETVANGRGYTLVLLWKGPVRDRSEAEADRLQQDHLRHLFTLRNEGSLLLNGPVLDDGDLAGSGGLPPASAGRRPEQDHGITPVFRGAPRDCRLPGTVALERAPVITRPTV
jgi:uncharacterized protein YciI